jgi:type IV secretory pathway TraG/TraD family ATPase VirD4
MAGNFLLILWLRRLRQNNMHIFKSKNKNGFTKNSKQSFFSWSGAFRLVGKDPFVDWVIIFAVGCIVAIVLVYVGVVAYLNTDESLEKVPTPKGSNISSLVDIKTLDKVINKFEARSIENTDLSDGYMGVGDPSR